MPPATDATALKTRGTLHIFELGQNNRTRHQPLGRQLWEKQPHLRRSVNLTAVHLANQKPRPPNARPASFPERRPRRGASNSGRPLPMRTETGWACWSSAPPPAACALASRGSLGAMNHTAAASSAVPQRLVPALAPQDVAQAGFLLPAAGAGALERRLAGALRPGGGAAEDICESTVVLWHRLYRSRRAGTSSQRRLWLHAPRLLGAPPRPKRLFARKFQRNSRRRLAAEPLQPALAAVEAATSPRSTHRLDVLHRRPPGPGASARGDPSDGEVAALQSQRDR